MPVTGPDGLQDVHEGMQVVDASGTAMGTVDAVQFASGEGVTTVDSEPNGGRGFVADLVLPEAPGPDVPEPLRSRLMLSGYIEVDGPGLTDGDRYVSADQVAGVDGDVVRLSVGRDATMPEMR